MDYLPLIGRLMGRKKCSTGPDDAATQLHGLLGAVIPEAVGKYVASLPPPQEQRNQSFMAPVLLDNNFTRKVITLLNEFDEWNRIRANPQFGDHVSRIVGGLLKGVRELTILPGFGSRYESYLFDNAPFYIYMLLRLLEELDIGKIQDREAGLEILNEVASQICDSIFRSPSPDEAMVRAKDDTIVASLKVLQQDDPSLFDLILRLLSSRCSSAALLQRTFLTPQRELQLQILHLTLLFLKGIQNENQLVYTWNSFVQDQFFSRSSSILLVDFFNKPPVLYKQLSAKMPPQVSLSVLQGAVKLFEREIGGADRESAEATRDLVVKSVCSICPGGFSIPEGNTDVIRDLSKCYYDLLNLTCPSLRQGETGNAQRMGLWWYWLEWVTLAAGLEDLPQKQSLTAPFLERTLQYGLEAVRSTLSEDTLKFFDASVALKMMFNYSAGTRTLQLRTEFEREYEVSVINPHWCFTNVFNHFRGDSLITLIEESLRGNYTIVDSNRNWVSGCRDSRRAIAVYQRTTFMTMELGKCTLESLISSRIASIEQQTEEVLPTVPTSQQLQSMSPQNQHHPLCQSKDVLQLAFCVLCAVDHLNTRGWFHCDIKPDNILLMERPHIKGNIWALCDLGTAVFCEDGNPLVLPKGETFTGNAENRSPEVIQAEREFPLLKNDVWAVGCVLYEVVSGRHPFTNENQVNNNLIRDTTLPPVVPDCSSLTHDTHTDPTISPALVSGLVGWLLERECTRRPNSREALLTCSALLILPKQVITTFVTHIQQQRAQKNSAPSVTSTQPPNQSTSATATSEHPQPTQSISEDMITAIRQALLEVQKRTVTDVFQHNGLRFGTDVVPSVTSPTFEPLQATVNEVMSLVYCNMALRDVPAAARALISFLDAASSPRYNLNILS